jgi:hypothetical protein
MKHVCLILAGLLLLTVFAAGCQPSAHDRYRQMTYRRVADADVLGWQDDIDAAVLLTERPTHLSQWYHP